MRPPDDPDPRLEHDEPDQVLGLISVIVRWSDPSAVLPDGGAVMVLKDRVVGMAGPHEVELPLAGLRIATASSTRRGRRRKAVDTFWLLDVTGPDATLSIMGRWLMVAQLGTLARWPEPK